jgi:oxygen-independent coproporphyrinogen-3 oxidase
MNTLSHESDALERRMQGPQRHRLLHSYPLAAAMKKRSAPAEDLPFDRAIGRGLLVGVLPHPFCNPSVTGCGFCTFPHQKYNVASAREVSAAVCREIEDRVRRQGELRGRDVTALYFGGATANLTAPESFRALCRTLAQTFDLTRAEITLEGVPAYFLHRQPMLIDILRDEIRARHFRISMGVQSFDKTQLERMGRLHFGDESTFRTVAEEAHGRGFTVSADMLYNLPHQTLPQMLDDVQKAMDIGLDHLGLYHLVLFRGLGTAWSRDPELLQALPDNDEAAENWLTLREYLLENGYYQATLTNFERDRFNGDARRFVYEESSFQPNRFEMIGFGPSAISFSAGRDFAAGRKVMNPDSSQDYLDSVNAGGATWDRYFDYGGLDLRILYLTRRLSALEIDRLDYAELFGADPLEEFAQAFEPALAQGLLMETGDTIRPTAKGIFYADSIASLWAKKWANAKLDHNGVGYM